MGWDPGSLKGFKILESSLRLLKVRDLISESLQDRYRKVRAFLKPLLERQSVRSAVEPLVVEAAEKKQDTFHDWLSEEPARDRVRDISKCNRLQSGVAKWPME